MTNILALIGALTGVAGLLIQFASFLFSKPKVSVEQVPNQFKSLWIVPENDTYITSESYKFNESIEYSVIYIQLTINNRSPQSVTILEPFLSINKSRLMWTPETFLNLDTPAIKSEDGKMEWTYKFPQKEQLQFPLRINGFDSVTGSVVLVNIGSSTKIDNVLLNIPTTAKVFKKRFRLDEFSEWHRMATEDLKS